MVHGLACIYKQEIRRVYSVKYSTCSLALIIIIGAFLSYEITSSARESNRQIGLLHG